MVYITMLAGLILLATSVFFAGTLRGQDDVQVIISITFICVILGIIAATIFACGIVLLVDKYDKRDVRGKVPDSPEPPPTPPVRRTL